MKTRYMIRTSEIDATDAYLYLGRMSLDEQLHPVPAAFGYVYDTEEQAAAAAATFDGPTVVEIFDPSRI